MPTLLGHLAQFAALTSQAEVLCTQGLTHLLRHPPTNAAFRALLADRTARPLPAELAWRAEVYQAADRARPDLEACGPDGLPCVKVEAKLDASLLPPQLHAYAADLQARSAGGTLILLVPQRRQHDVVRIAHGAVGANGPGPWQPAAYPGVVVAVVSWEDAFAALRAEAAGRSAYEVEALAEMYVALAGRAIAPLASSDELLRWRERASDMVRLVDEATRRLVGGDKVYPLGREPLASEPDDLEPQGYLRRYVCRPLEGALPCFSVGVRDPYEGFATPIWLRFNATTPCFALIRDRLVASPLEPRVVHSGRHVWMPLDVPLNADEEAMVAGLVGQVEAIATVAYAP